MNRDTKTTTKLSTTLALFYLHSPGGLSTSVTKLVLCCMGMDISQITPESSIRSIEKSQLSSLSPELYNMVLMYITALAEEAGKLMSQLTPEYVCQLAFRGVQTI